jgi:hypothetical protein
VFDQVVTPSIVEITCLPRHERRLFRLVSAYAGSLPGGLQANSNLATHYILGMHYVWSLSSSGAESDWRPSGSLATRDRNRPGDQQASTRIQVPAPNGLI